ncbi:MAG: LemA family protein [Pseudomonadota bacterium]
MEFILILAVLAIVYVYIHNGLVSSKLKVDEGWSGITFQLKRRHALVHNLVEAVQSAINQEMSIIDTIVDARTKALSAVAQNNHAKVTEAEADLSNALRAFIAHTENRPELASSATIGKLQSLLEDTEDQIYAARRLYNGNAQTYNGKVLRIPWNFIALIKGFKTVHRYEVDPVEIKITSRKVGLNLAASKA